MPLFAPIASDNNRTVHIELCLLCSERCTRHMYEGGLSETTRAQRKLGHASHIPDTLEFLWHSFVLAMHVFAVYDMHNNGILGYHSATDFTLWTLVARALCLVFVFFRDVLWIIEGSVGSISQFRYFASLATIATVPAQFIWNLIYFGFYFTSLNALSYDPYFVNISVINSLVNSTTSSVNSTSILDTTATTASTTNAKVLESASSLHATFPLFIVLTHILPLISILVDTFVYYPLARAYLAKGLKEHIIQALSTLFIPSLYTVFVCCLASSTGAYPYTFIKDFATSISLSSMITNGSHVPALLILCPLFFGFILLGHGCHVCLLNLIGQMVAFTDLEKSTKRTNKKNKSKTALPSSTTTPRNENAASTVNSCNNTDDSTAADKSTVGTKAKSE